VVIAVSTGNIQLQRFVFTVYVALSANGIYPKLFNNRLEFIGDTKIKQERIYRYLLILPADLKMKVRTR
jgi:hypothetical protein